MVVKVRDVNRLFISVPLTDSTSFRPVLGPTQPPIQWVPGVERSGREADHSPTTSAEVRNTWIYTSTLLYVFVA
jgi:hypothetical protein